MPICECALTLIVITYSKCAFGLKCPRSSQTGENPKQRIPLEEYVANLTSTVQHLQSVGVPESRLIRITPPPLCEAARGQERVSS